MGRVADLGCAICRMIGLGKTPAHVHHPRTGTGAGRRSSHWDTIPLCPQHHTGNDGIHGMGRKAFERHYGVTEAELMFTDSTSIGISDMSAIYQEFVLRSPAIWNRIVEFIRAHAKACMERDKPLLIIVTEADRKRTLEQNRFFHGPILDAITEQAWWGGKQYPKEFWKEYFRNRYLLKDEYTTPDGEIVQVYYSTADLTVAQMAIPVAAS